MSNGDRATVLIVGAEPQLGTRYASWLEDRYEVFTAQNEEAALKQLAERGVDVILFDGFPRAEGAPDRLEALTDTGDGCRMAVIAHDHPAPQRLDGLAGDYLLKPITSDDLQNLVDSLVRLSEYDELVQESFSIASKLRVLSDGNGSSERPNPDEYRELRSRLKRLRGQIDRSISTFDERELGHVYRDIVPRDSASE